MNIAFLTNLAGPDGILIMLIVLLLFGAKKLPELAKGMGQAVREFSKAKDEIEREVTRPPTPEPARHLEAPVTPVTEVTTVETPKAESETTSTTRYS